MKLKLNHAIWLLTMSDVFTWGLQAIISSLAGIYLSGRIPGEASGYIGIGLAVYMFSRAIFQPVIGTLADKRRGDKDEILFVSLGSILMGLPYLGYPLISAAWVYYLLQFVFGLGAAMNLVGWRKLFAQNLDHNREGQEYGAYGLVMGLSTAAFAASAGFVSTLGEQYFSMVIVIIGLVMIASSGFGLLLLRDHGRLSDHIEN